MSSPLATMSREVEQAVRRLVNGFACIPQEWAALVAEHLDGDGCVSMPIWGTLFKVDDSCDESNIRGLLKPIGPAGCSNVSELLDFIESEGLEVENLSALQALAAAEDDDADIDDLRDEVEEAWRESEVEDSFFAMDGWQAVGDTGIIAREFDGCLLLGIHGAGYSFHDTHWIQLYRELRYT